LRSSGAKDTGGVGSYTGPPLENLAVKKQSADAMMRLFDCDYHPKMRVLSK
jgi:hypothetical protein